MTGFDERPAAPCRIWDVALSARIPRRGYARVRDALEAGLPGLTPTLATAMCDQRRITVLVQATDALEAGRRAVAAVEPILAAHHAGPAYLHETCAA